MSALASESVYSVSRKLLDLLEEARHPRLTTHASNFNDRLDALEVEALETCTAGGTLVVIRAAREAVAFAERIAIRSPRS